MASQRTFEDLDLSKDEVKRLGEALKDETFRKLLVEYAEEISDPENRRKAEEEIAMMENERGMNVQFVRPEPGYVIKTTVNGSLKAFINICQNDKIGKPSAKRQVGPDGKGGMMWQIPHSFAPPKDDVDKDKEKCRVFDVVFHPDTYRMSTTNERFRKIVEDTALDGIEKQFSVTLDKKNIKHPKMKFKGIQTATVIRERIEDAVQNPNDQGDILNNLPYPYDNKTSSEKANENILRNENKKNAVQNGKSKSDESPFTEPKYSIIHRSDVDMSEYRNAPDAKISTRPKELVIKIELPLLKSAAQADLDIFEKKLVLESVSPAAYKLELALPFPVNDNEGTAKFDKSKKTLTVTLPVLQTIVPELPFAQVTESNQSETNDREKAAPLIEVLSDSTKSNGFHENSISKLPSKAEVDEISMKVDVSSRESCSDKMTFPQNVKWVLPSYQFSQDNETVSFVIKVQNVEEKATLMNFPSSSTAVLQFMSVGSGCFPVYYSLFVEFPGDCDISSDHCSIDVSDDNLVFIILKDKKCRGLWETFKIGIDDTQLEEKQFLTEGNLQKELSGLDREALEASMPLQEETTAQLSVVEMNDKRLTIDIKPPKGKDKKHEEEEEGDDDTDTPSSAEIEVVHKHPTPNLHSILKARTISESSEDYNHQDPESPRSESEELSSSLGKRRSVSFSNHIDHASFKSSASVSSMTPALKSKRRRQRKRDERRKAKVRRSSEGSSGDDNLHSVSDSYSHSEEEGEAFDKSNVEKRTALTRALSDPGPGSLPIIIDEDDERAKSSGDHGKKKKRNKKEKAEGSIPQGNDSFDFRTNQGKSRSVGDVQNQQENFAGSKQEQNVNDGSGQKNTNGGGVGEEGSQEKKNANRNKKIISEIKNKLSGGGDTGAVAEDSDDDNFEDAVSSLTEDFSSKVKVHSVDQESVQGGKKLGFVQDKDLNHSIGKESAFEKESCNNKGDSGDGGNEKSDVETMLSWNDGQGKGGEHVTKCEFQFSNSVMFDLDVD